MAGRHGVRAVKPVLLPPVKYLRECVRYEKRTGFLFWRKRPRRHFSRTSDWRRFNNMFAGEPAFATISVAGYRYGLLNKRIYLAHRIAWKLVTGVEPPDILDHRDHDRANNKWKNLREATTYQNCAYRRGRKNSVSGCKGVYKSRARWLVRVRVKGVRHYLGTFDTIELARAARLKAIKQMNGEFAL